LRTKPAETMRRLGQCLLVGALVVAPWLTGALLSEAQFWLYSCVAAATVCYAVYGASAMSAPRRPPLTWAFVALGIPLGFLQLMPVSAGTLETLSPTAAKWYAAASPERFPVLGATDPLSPKGIAVGRPVSIAPFLTRDQLSMLIAAAAVLLLAAQLFDTNEERRWVLRLLFVNGVLLAFVGLRQKLTGEGLGWWHPHGNGFGPFVNRNNGAGYVGMCFAAGVALLWPQDSKFRWSNVTAEIAAYVVGLIVIAAAMATSMSRGAVVSITAGVVVTAVSVAVLHRAWRLALALVALLCAALGATIYLNQGDDLEKRLATLTDVNALQYDGRVVNWSQGSAAAAHYLWTGSGLGTYRYAYTPYQVRPTRERFLTPQNAFLQTAVEAGVVGVALFVCGLVSALWTAIRLLRSKYDPTGAPFGVLGVLLLTTQSVHCCLDNGFYLFANAVLLASISGIFLGAGQNSAQKAEAEGSWSRLVAGGMGLTMLSAVLWSVAVQGRSVPIDRARRAAANVVDAPSTPFAAVATAIGDFETALEREPDSAEAGLRVAEMYLTAFRLRAYEQFNLELGARNADGNWLNAAHTTLYAAAVRLERREDEPGLRSLRNQPLVLRYLVPAWRHLHASLDAAPGDARVHVLLGELNYLVGNPSDGGAWFQQAAELGPKRPSLLFRCGLNQLDAGETEAAVAFFRQAMAVDPLLRDRVLKATEGRLTSEQRRRLVADAS
jgi:O-antigen ligase